MTGNAHDTQLAIVEALDEAELKAWQSLARYKLLMFGYHAAAWVKFNRLQAPADRRRNPFRSLVLVARGELAGRS